MMPWKKNGAIATYLQKSSGDIPAADLCDTILMDGCEDPMEEVEERATQEAFAGRLQKTDARLWNEIFGTSRTITEIAARHSLARDVMVQRITKLIIRYLDFRES